MSLPGLEPVKAAARLAGEAILEIYARDFDVETKADSSPLTEADEKANAIIVAALKESYPDIPIISEEIRALPFDVRKEWTRCWLVDPLDGTKEFIKKNGEFTVNIALIENGEPVMGVVYRPVTDTLYFASKGEGAWKQDGVDSEPVKIFNSRHYSQEQEVIVVASRSHLTPETERFVEDLRAEGKNVEFLSAGSSLKLCLVAEGKASVYPRFGPTMEWDTGAAHAVVLESGKKVLCHDTGLALEYNKEDLLNPWFIVE